MLRKPESLCLSALKDMSQLQLWAKTRQRGDLRAQELGIAHSRDSCN